MRLVAIMVIGFALVAWDLSNNGGNVNLPHRREGTAPICFRDG